MTYYNLKGNTVRDCSGIFVSDSEEPTFIGNTCSGGCMNLRDYLYIFYDIVDFDVYDVKHYGSLWKRFLRWINIFHDEEW